jgi:hypothetical protein
MNKFKEKEKKKKRNNTDKIANYNYKRSAVFILFDGVKNTDTHKKNTDKQSKQAFNRINN